MCVLKKPLHILKKTWAHAKRNLMNGDRWASANEAQSDRWIHNKRYVNALWTQDEQFIRSALGIILKLYFVGYNGKRKLKTTYRAAVIEVGKQSHFILYPVHYILSCKLYIYILFYLIPYYLYFWIVRVK